MIRSRTVVIRSIGNIQLQQTINKQKTVCEIFEGRRCLKVLIRKWKAPANSAFKPVASSAMGSGSDLDHSDTNAVVPKAHIRKRSHKHRCVREDHWNNCLTLQSTQLCLVEFLEPSEFE